VEQGVGEKLVCVCTTEGSLRAADTVCHRRCLLELLHSGEAGKPRVWPRSLLALVDQILIVPGQLCRVHWRGGLRRSCRGRVFLRSVGAAAGTFVTKLLSSDDLALAVAEPHVLALATTLHLATLPACEARGRSWRHRRSKRRAGSAARPGGGRRARYHLGIGARCHLGIGARRCSVGGAAVGAGVALPCGDDLTLSVAEPYNPAPAAS